MKIALKIAYLGESYHGFQCQPDQVTVELVIRRALQNLELSPGGFSYAGRTDRGVSALGQVVAFEIDSEKRKMAAPRVINTRLPGDVWAWASAVVPDHFSARRSALWRRYRYFLYSVGLDLDSIQEAASALIGTHDFKNFSKEKRMSTRREVMSLALEERAGFVIVDIKADSFLWEMVRRIAGALAMIGSGEKDAGWIYDLLDPERNIGVAPAPPDGLILMEVGYPEIVWDSDSYAKKRASLMLSKKMKSQLQRGEVMRELLFSIGGSPK